MNIFSGTTVAADAVLPQELKVLRLLSSRVMSVTTVKNNVIKEGPGFCGAW